MRGRTSNSLFPVPGVLCAFMARDPAGVAVGIVLLFPDRDAALGLIDDVLASVERGPTMDRRHADPHGNLPDGEIARAMDAPGIEDLKLSPRLGEDPSFFSHTQHTI